MNPKPKTFFHQRLIDRKELIYDSKLKKPLGLVPDQTGKFAEGISVEDTFGIKTEKSDPAGLVINPKFSRDEVSQQANEGLFII